MDRLQSIPAKTPLLIFLISAGIGVWASYDPASASAKLTQLAFALIVYLVLATWPVQQMDLASDLVSGLVAAIALYFLWTADWARSPADLGFLNRLGLAWMGLRLQPPAVLPQFQPNIAGGLIAALLPLNLASIQSAWNKRQPNRTTAALLAFGLSVSGLLMTSSRAAWLALAVGFSLWLWWWASRLAAARLQTQHILLFSLPVMVVVLAAGVIVWVQSGSLVNLANSVPGAASAGSRAEIVLNSLHLSRDFFFTGGGLAAFPGLYARYMRVIQVYEFGYAHNLFLDLLIEQGIFGLGAFLWLVLSSGIWLWQALRNKAALAAPLLTGLVILLLHGFTDDAFYGLGGTPLIFVLPGFAAAIRETGEAEPGKSVFSKRTRTAIAAIASGVILIVMLLPATRSGVYANLGAVQMAKIQLAGWPEHAYNEPAAFLAAVQPAEALFTQALELDPTNPTALYRLGIIAGEKGDFQAANSYLTAAFASSPAHRGIRKTLGYNYVWLNQPEQAVELLSTIPEAVTELGIYAWWWETQDRMDLSMFAQEVHERLK